MSALSDAERRLEHYEDRLKALQGSADAEEVERTTARRDHFYAQARALYDAEQERDDRDRWLGYLSRDETEG